MADFIPSNSVIDFRPIASIVVAFEESSTGSFDDFHYFNANCRPIASARSINVPISMHVNDGGEPHVAREFLERVSHACWK
jgi:hypothetical protein